MVSCLRRAPRRTETSSGESGAAVGTSAWSPRWSISSIRSVRYWEADSRTRWRKLARSFASTTSSRASALMSYPPSLLWASLQTVVPWSPFPSATAERSRRANMCFVLCGSSAHHSKMASSRWRTGRSRARPTRAFRLVGSITGSRARRLKAARHPRHHAAAKDVRLVMAENLDNEISLVRIEDLRHCLVAAFERLELPLEDAGQVADVLLDSELRGHESHGVHLLGFLVDAYRGGMNPQPRIRVLRETEGALLLDGDRSHVVGAVRAMRWCIERARERKGMVVAGVRDSQLIVPGFYARMAAETGLIGFACANAVPMVAPPGGRTPTIGTNPFAYAIPAGRYPPVVLDVATTTGAAFKVRLAAQRNHPVPEGMILDSEGHPTTDPNEFVRGGLMAPLGSPAAPHKGFGLGLVIDALAGVLTGAAFARDFPSEPATAGNAFFWALDVEAFLAREEFLERMEAQIDQVKAGERLADVDELFLPGERSDRRYRELTTRGTAPLSGTTWEALTKALASLSISPPPALAAEPRRSDSELT